MKNGEIIGHGGDVYYMSPGEDYGRYLCEGVKRALDAGAEAIHLEEPEYWVRAGWEGNFKRQWQKYYNEPWIEPDSSPDAQYRASKLKYHLYKKALAEVFAFVKRVRQGARPRHQVLRADALDDQLRALGHRQPASRRCSRSAPTASSRRSGPAPAHAELLRRRRAPADVRDRVPRVRRDAEHRPRQREARLVPQRPDRGQPAALVVGLPHQLGEHAGRVAAPAGGVALRDHALAAPHLREGRTRRRSRARATRAATCRASRSRTSTRPSCRPSSPRWATCTSRPTASGGSTSARCGTGVLVSDTLMFQRFGPDCIRLAPRALLRPGAAAADARPAGRAGADRDGASCDRYKTLLLSYEGQKPPKPEFHDTLAAWVKAGGALIVIDDDRDPFHKVREWWNTGDDAIRHAAAPPVRQARPRPRRDRAAQGRRGARSSSKAARRRVSAARTAAPSASAPRSSRRWRRRARRGRNRPRWSSAAGRTSSPPASMTSRGRRDAGHAQGPLHPALRRRPAGGQRVRRRRRRPRLAGRPRPLSERPRRRRRRRLPRDERKGDGRIGHASTRSARRRRTPSSACCCRPPRAGVTVDGKALAADAFDFKRLAFFASAFPTAPAR